jgi:hypothetical protein
MKKKGALVKWLFSCVFSLCMLSLYTTSCLSYDEDIDDIYEKIKNLQSQIDEIKQKIEGKHFIKTVESITGGMKVTFDDGKEYNIINGTNGENGAPGEPGTRWIIGVDSLWHKDDDPNPFTDGGKTFRAIGKDGIQGENSPSPIIYEENDMYYWIVFEWDDVANAFMPDTAWDKPLKGYNTYVVDRGTYYELNVWVQNLTTPENGKYEKIDLPKYSESSDPYFLEFLGYDQIKNPYRPISLGRIKNDITFYYWYLSSIHNATDGGDTTLWVGQKTVKKDQVLTTLVRDSAAAIIRTNLPTISWKLTLKNSKGELLPISFGAPIKHKGDLTKALGNDSIYILQMDGIQETFLSENNYRSKFLTETGSGFVYSLVDTVSGINSGYQTFILSPIKGNSTLPPPTTVLTIGGESGTQNGAYKEYLINTSETDNNEIVFADKAFVYDYYVEAVDTTLANKFGFIPNKANGTFKVTQTDPVEEEFKLVVYQLQYNGNFYKDTVLIKPL